MRLKSVSIKEFKRFTDLTVEGMPDTAQLIMLAGPNGCGKSSFLDALHTWHKWTTRKHPSWEVDYHVKTGSPVRDRWRNDVQLEFHSPEPDPVSKKTFFVRSAYRNDPEFQVQNLQRVGDPLDEIRVERMIDNDGAVDGRGVGSTRRGHRSALGRYGGVLGALLGALWGRDRVKP